MSVLGPDGKPLGGGEEEARISFSEQVLQTAQGLGMEVRMAKIGELDVPVVVDPGLAPGQMLLLGWDPQGGVVVGNVAVPTPVTEAEEE